MLVYELHVLFLLEKGNVDKVYQARDSSKDDETGQDEDTVR